MEEDKCHSCGAKTDWICERCQQLVCENCTVPFTQFNQIDYTLCNNCHDSHELERSKEQAEQDFYDSLSEAEQKTYYSTNSTLRIISKNLKTKLGN